MDAQEKQITETTANVAPVAPVALTRHDFPDLYFVGNFAALRRGGDGTFDAARAQQERALSCVRGSYQHGLVRGHEAHSGSTLRGKAKDYGGKYRDSRDNLLCRLWAEGIALSVQRCQGVHRTMGTINRDVIVFG
jgi:hypothetical protein